ncbi:hypothetical protein, partial [Thermofilum sp.]|uniref:hypothetical protein n=1 Tax=Thermofilum sp. TaxID=1961369 RepID=UPI0025858396
NRLYPFVAFYKLKVSLRRIKANKQIERKYKVTVVTIRVMVFWRTTFSLSMKNRAITPTKGKKVTMLKI